MKTQDKFIFPFPPSVNTLYFQGPKHGQKFLSKKGKQFKATVHELYADDERQPIEGHLEVHLEYILPDLRERDLDNYVKAILDGLVDINAIVDDSQIKAFHPVCLGKCAEISKGAVFITIRTYEYSEEMSLALSQQYKQLLISEFGYDKIEHITSNSDVKNINEPVFHKPKKTYIKKKDRKVE